MKTTRKHKTLEKPMNRGPSTHLALAVAIAIIAKIPVTFTRVMFAPEILATIQQLADDFKEEIAQLRSKHGTWRFFLVMPKLAVGIDRGGEAGCVGTDACVNKRDYHRREWFTTVLNTHAEILVHHSPIKARLYLFSLNLRNSEVIIWKNAEPGRNDWQATGGNGCGRI